MRGIRRKQNLLNFPGDLNVMIECVLLSGGQMNGLIEQGEGCLLHDRLEELDLCIAEGITSRLPC